SNSSGKRPSSRNGEPSNSERLTFNGRVPRALNKRRHNGVPNNSGRLKFSGRMPYAPSRMPPACSKKLDSVRLNKRRRLKTKRNAIFLEL
ncbi:hypothetical protein ABTG29_18570, partial [Acinetobacter baumannii]